MFVRFSRLFFFYFSFFLKKIIFLQCSSNGRDTAVADMWGKVSAINVSFQTKRKKFLGKFSRPGLTFGFDINPAVINNH
jgi:hypothetical protein